MSGIEVTALQALLIALAFVFGGVVKGAAGFGLPLITISLMPLFIPLDLALALNTLVVPLTNIAQFVAAGGYRRSFEICWPLIAGLCITVFITAVFVVSITPATLSAVMGVLLLAYVLHAFMGRGVRISTGAMRPASFVAGLAGGIVGAVMTAPGPVYAAFLFGLRLERRQLISAMGLAMLASGILVTGAFAAVGILDGPRALMSLVCVAFGLFGMWLGDRIGQRISVEGFNRMILVMLLGLGLYHCGRGFL
ncbi:MAG: sulfite exporter TauE/SafE family protein [Pseudomonadota bacterium]